MVHEGLVAAFILLTLTNAIASESMDVRLQGPSSSNVYDDFMKLSPRERRARFSALSAEQRATIVQTNVRRWINSNRDRLSAGELAVFEEIVAFLSPELSSHHTGAANKREDALKARMRCRVATEDVKQATNVFGETAESPYRTMQWTYLTQAKCWVEWMIESAVDYLPNIGAVSQSHPRRGRYREFEPWPDASLVATSR